MKQTLKKTLTVNNCFNLLALIFGLIGGIMFIVTATTGYLAGTSYNVMVFVYALLGVVAICGGICLNAYQPKFGTFLYVVAAVLLSVAFMEALRDRIDFIGDSFIPMERPAEFHSAISATITSMVFIVVPVLLLAIGCFVPEIKFVKEEQAEAE